MSAIVEILVARKSCKNSIVKLSKLPAKVTTMQVNKYPPVYFRKIIVENKIPKGTKKRIFIKKSLTSRD